MNDGNEGKEMDSGLHSNSLISYKGVRLDSDHVTWFSTILGNFSGWTPKLEKYVAAKETCWC